VVRRPPEWSIETTPRPASIPANTTTPAPTESTGSPGAPARSTPRCPGPYGFAGGSNARVTGGRPASGQPHGPPRARTRPAADADRLNTVPPPVAADGGPAAAGGGPAAEPPGESAATGGGPAAAGGPVAEPPGGSAATGGGPAAAGGGPATAGAEVATRARATAGTSRRLLVRTAGRAAMRRRHQGRKGRNGRKRMRQPWSGQERDGSPNVRSVDSRDPCGRRLGGGGPRRRTLVVRPATAGRLRVSSSHRVGGGGPPRSLPTAPPGEHGDRDIGHQGGGHPVVATTEEGSSGARKAGLPEARRRRRDGWPSSP
jgi:hypothetical protein